jgi:hypothetical protein
MALRQVYNNFFIGTKAQLSTTTMNAGCVFLAEDLKEFYGVDLSGNTFYIGGALTGHTHTLSQIVGLEAALNYKLESVSGFTTDNAILRVDGSGKITQESLVTISDSGSVFIPSGQTYNIGGVPLVSDKNYVHTQLSASTTWNVTHGLNKIPAVKIKDSLGQEIIGHINDIDNNNTQLSFNSAIIGSAIFN